jgi:transcriptional regulator with XRE-family HTH domain
MSEITAQNVKDLRLKLKLSYTELASRLGVSYHTVWSIESGKRPITFLMGERIKSIANQATK